MKNGHAHPLVALLTDFGLSDNFVGVVKGVILRDCPTAVLIDITHSVPPQSILHASLCLKNAYPYFPDETLFLAVVDPGVGTSRGIVAVRLEGRIFVAPDNGLLWPLIEAEDNAELWEITWRPEDERGATFHGRDIFAPVVARLAAGAALDEVGERVESIVRLDIPRPESDGAVIRGEVIYVDGFGNLATNVSRGLIEEKFNGEYPPVLRVQIGDGEVSGAPGAYGSVARDEAVLVFNSFDLLEIAVNCGDAARNFGAGVGTAIAVSFK